MNDVLGPQSPASPPLNVAGGEKAFAVRRVRTQRAALGLNNDTFIP